MPIFFLVFDSNGRFYTAAGVSLLVAAVPLLFERGLLPAGPTPSGVRAAVSSPASGCSSSDGRLVEDWVRANDALHYWAPILDPDRSTLKFVVR